MGIARLLYTIGVGAYHAGIRFSATFNPKAKQWVDGRKGWQDNLKAMLNGKPTIWVHCASLGEYEQGKPVIEALEKEYPEKQTVVSFYSPSGYEVVKRREPNRAIIYLPADSEANAKAFLLTLNPVLAIFIKYEFWYYHLRQLRDHRVPTLLVSGIFRIEQPFFKPWGQLHREMLACFSHFFVQDAVSEYLLKDIGFHNVSISGDTRFDRVVAILYNPVPLPIIKAFKADAPVLVAGSTWPADEKILVPLLPDLIANGWKLILAPHDINDAHVQQLAKSLGEQAMRYTEATETNTQNKQVLIIDNVGLLAHIYKYGELAYIGGGFGKGIHNILEAAASGLPIIFGPNYNKFKEAKDLTVDGGAFVVRSSEEMKQVLAALMQDEYYLKAAQTSARYVHDNIGATEKVMEYIHKAFAPIPQSTLWKLGKL